MKMFLVSVLTLFALIPLAFSMGRNNAGGGGGVDIGGVIQAEKDVVNSVGSIANSNKAYQLRLQLTTLTGQVMRVGGYTPQMYGNSVGNVNSKIQEASAAMDTVINGLGGATSVTTMSVLNNIKSELQGYNIPGLFQNYPLIVDNQTRSSSMWDTYFYPIIAANLIHLQSTYAVALINYISQNATSLTSNQIDGLLHIVGGLISAVSKV